MAADPYPNSWPWREGHADPPDPDAVLRAAIERLKPAEYPPRPITIHVKHLQITRAQPAPFDDEDGYWAD